jgi:hypothetical protein
VIGVVGLLLVMSAGADEVYRPEVPILKVAHVGDPVPGIPGATFYYFYPPKIDGAGNVLLVAWMVGPGIDDSNRCSIWYGPPGAIEMIARDGDQAPGMAPGVVFVNVTLWAVVSETGLIAFSAYVAGPGIVAYENDGVVYCGYPGAFQKVMQTGVPVAEIGPDVYLDGTCAPGAGLTDNGTLFIGADICGPGLDPFARAYWLGSADDLELVIWDGMPFSGCPECEPGVILEWSSWIAFNDAGEMAFNGCMSGPGIDWSNDEARWQGPPGNWEMLHREGDAVPEFGARVKIRSATGLMYALNAYGDKVSRIRLYGPGITEANDWVLLAGYAEDAEMGVLARDGDPVPAAGEDVYVAFAAGGIIDNLRQVLYRLTLGGPSIDDSNRYAVYYGPYEDTRMILRDGEPADYFPSGTVVKGCGAVESFLAMNDVGDFVTLIGIHQVGGEEGYVLWVRRGLTGQYVPVLEPGQDVWGRTVATTSSGALGYYWDGTGGADGQPQSFNDQRQLAILLDFTDETMGVYRIGPPLLGDIDGDGEVTAVELAAFADCVTYQDDPGAMECAPFDLNLDGHIDMEDFRLLQLLVGEPR